MEGEDTVRGVQNITRPQDVPPSPVSRDENMDIALDFDGNENADADASSETETETLSLNSSLLSPPSSSATLSALMTSTSRIIKNVKNCVGKNPVDYDSDTNAIDDLTNLQEITLSNVLDCLIQRFKNDEFYTFAGSVLISLNPCSHHNRHNHTISNKSTEDNLQFRSRFSHIHSIGNQTELSTNGKLKPKPHVYSVGAKCLENLKRNGNHQIVVVSGDTGAGKTTATQQLLSFFIHSSPEIKEQSLPLAPSNSNYRLQEKIYSATLILESLGNASTVANPNSSRFGRFLHLNYLNSRCSDGISGIQNQNFVSGSTSILGAQIQTCLLEKHRVSKCQPNERNFHIFYYTLIGLREGLLNRLACFDDGGALNNLKLESDLGPNVDLDVTGVGPTPANLLKLIPSSISSSVQSTDEEGFSNLMESMKALDFDQDEVESIFEIIFGLMLLLGFKFVPVKSGESKSRSRSCTPVHGEGENESDNEKENENQNAKVNDFLRNKSHFRLSTGSGDNIICNWNDDGDDSGSVSIASTFERIFSVDFGSIEDCLVARNFTAGKRKSCVRKPCETSRECEERLSALVTTLYEALFQYILQRVNGILSSRSGSADLDHDVDVHLSKYNNNKISLLDLYGFENLTGQNHFEQLCINYANERLHQIHILHAKTHFEEIQNWMEMEVESEQRVSSGSGCGLSVFEKLGGEMSLRLNAFHARLFAILNEACVLNRSQSDEQLYSRLKVDGRATKVNAFSSSNTSKAYANANAKNGVREEEIIRSGKLFENKCEFVVKHYAADVQYSLKGMVDKNRDYVPPELLDLLEGSSNKLIRKMMAGSRDRDRDLKNSNNSSHRDTNSVSGMREVIGNNRMDASCGRLKSVGKYLKAVAQRKEKKTVLQRFKSSVDGLVKELDPVVNVNVNCDTKDVHFIRCIRPNHQLHKGQVDRKLVEQQLYSTGIVDFIRITGNGFPIRVSKLKFLQKFGKTIKKCYGGNGNGSIGFDFGRNWEKNDRESNANCLSLNKLMTKLKFDGRGGDEGLAGIRVGKTQVFMREETWNFLCGLDKVILVRAARTVQSAWRKYQRTLKEEALARAKAEAAELLALAAAAAEAEAQDWKEKQRKETEEMEALKTFSFQRTADWVGQVNQVSVNQFRMKSVSLSQIETGFLRKVQIVIQEEQEPEDSDSKESLRGFGNVGKGGTKADVDTGANSISVNPMVPSRSRGPQGDFNCPISVNVEEMSKRDRNRTSVYLGAGDGEELKRKILLQLKEGKTGKRMKVKMVANLEGFGFFLNQDKSIVSRRHVYQSRVRVYLRKTALANSHVFPLRLMPQGLLDLLP